ncbi:MAG: adenylate/guanylate cyclase domain-containing protein, partial [Desulfobulbaceae bacterium]|nr:adenylate/guanylate cyclase domain-containing protein [Desulfobulbaceae bacterium]
MAKEKVTKSILFADISKSTALYEQLGDSKAQKVIAAAIKLMIKAIVRHKGIVVKTIGDEVMSVFDEPISAMEAAILMQKLMEQLSAKLYHELNRPLNIQIGT